MVAFLLFFILGVILSAVLERVTGIIHLAYGKKYMNSITSRVQRDLNPRPTAPQAVILSKLNYGPCWKRWFFVIWTSLSFYAVLCALQFRSSFCNNSSRLSTALIGLQIWPYSASLEHEVNYFSACPGFWTHGEKQ
jgi:hypothetical protein